MITGHSSAGKHYWRSLDELAATPRFREWLHREFPEHASEMLDSASRRTLLKLMAASIGLAGLAACSRPVDKILPAARGVEGQTPGNPLYYATAMSLGGAATGLLVEAHEGRPTKIEGNPEHPASGGAASAFHQASLLGLYDPDRMRVVSVDGRPAGWEEFAAFAARHFAAPGRLRFLSQAVNSPSLEAVRAHALARFPGARWVEYEPVSQDEAVAGAELAFGRPLQPHYHFDRADVVLSLDADFLGLDAPALTAIRDFSRRRRAPEMNRLYVVESQFSITGAMADHRLRKRQSEIAQIAAELAGDRPASKWTATVLKDLEAHAGRALVVAGPRQPAAVHALAHWLNHRLAGETVTYTESRRPAQLPPLKRLAEEMAAGQVDTLVVFSGNPAYDAPADLAFGTALRKVPTTIYLGMEENETAALCRWRLAEAHYLETWGDARALGGTVAIQQPLIRPLHGGRSAAEVLALISGHKDQRGYDIVRNHWREQVWERCLNDGVVPGTVAQAVSPAEINKVSPPGPPPEALEVTFYPSASTWDGRFANNGWLQEAPDPMTKLTWDNAALLSPATARQHGLGNGDLVEIEAAGGKVRMPVWIQPGHADQAVSLALGYGRTRAGRVGEGVGHNAYPLRTTAQFHTVAGATLRKTGERYPLSTTQEHHSMEGRELVREGTLAGPPKQEPLKLFSLYGERSYADGNQWGMAVDLNACIGCNACVVACQAENNIPIVGKDQVARGREMHWIRLDRYYTGAEDDPQSVTQPVNCQQCENAPCENVCPVAATTHSPEGLNDMAYNRCVGTRYCLNNCPYKVRRFNFLDWHKGEAGVEKMVYNPDVSVRMRGVMEKCTYCVQRIQEKKIQAKLEGRRSIRDGEIQTACQQTCPAEAIVFGNINDPASRVAKLRQDSRNYSLLGELNTRPRTTYLAKLRNPNPEMEG